MLSQTDLKRSLYIYLNDHAYKYKYVICTISYIYISTHHYVYIFCT
jgi:hypothetical protein